MKTQNTKAEKKVVSTETLYDLLKGGNLKNGFFSKVNVKGVGPKELVQAESWLLKIAQVADKKTFCDFIEHRSLEKITLKLSNEEMKALKAGLWGWLGHFVRFGFDFGFTIDVCEL